MRALWEIWRSRLARVLILAGLVFAVSASSVSHVAAQSPTSPIIAHMFAKGSLSDQAAELLAQRLTAARLFPDVVVAGAGKLGDERENLRQLQSGSVEMTVVGDLVISYLAPKYRVVNFPFSHKNLEEAMAVYAGPVGDEVRAGLHDLGLEVLSWHCIGTRLLTANRAIRSKTDLKGLVLRLPPDPAIIAVWEGLGAAPKAVPFTQLYDALKRGDVTAQENPPNFIKAGKFYEVQSHLMLSRHLVQRQFILASRSFMENLDPEAAAQVREAATAVSDKVCSEAMASQENIIRWLGKEGGMTIVDLDLFDEAAAILPRVARQLDGEAGLALLQRMQGRHGN